MKHDQHRRELGKEYISIVLCVALVKPREASIAVTYACNARCEMCNIWKRTDSSVIEPRHYLKLPRSLRTINITGGEPFLRKDLVDVLKAIDSVVPSARIVFSSNGSLTETIVSRMRDIRAFHPRVGIGISIDGMEGTHDRIRGVPGIFKRAISTVEGLKQEGFTDLRIAMTLSEGNVYEAGKVLDLSRKLGVEFSITLAHDSEIYFQKTDNVSSVLLETVPRVLPELVQSQLRSRSIKDWFRAYHTNGISDPAIRETFISHCEAGKRYFFMSPAGDIFPCNVMNEKIGNLAEVSRWNELFPSDVEKRVRLAVQNCRRDCWMVCNTRSLIISHPFKAGAWVAKKKVISSLRKTS